MIVKAIRTDSWLGIKAGETYTAQMFEGSYGERIMVHTVGYTVLFNEDDFEMLNDQSD